MLSETLMLAVERSNTRWVKALLARGADVNACLEPGWAPLMEAVMRTEELVEILVAAGADPIFATERSYTPLARGRTWQGPHRRAAARRRC